MSRIIVLMAASAALLLMLTPFGSNPAVAGEEEEAAELDRITVVAPRITRERTRERGGRVEVITAEKTYYVDFDDLDLQRTVDLYRLEDRIAAAARQVCEELENQFPEGQPALSVCIQRAKDDAMAQAREAALAATR